MTQMNEYELEGEFEGEGFGGQNFGGQGFGEQGELHELEGEQFLGGLLKGVGGLMGLGEGEGEFEGEGFGGQNFAGQGFGGQNFGGQGEFEGEGEFELEGEQFFGAIKRLVRRVAPILKQVARIAAPIVGTAVGGPLGSVLGAAAGSLLKEGEFEGELEGEFELELEQEGPQTGAQQLAELMAAAASGAQTELEAEAMVGAAVTLILTPQERSELRRILPYMVRGAAILTRILRRRRDTRMFVRTLPTIVSSTARTMLGGQQAGRPLSRARTARVMAAQTRRVLLPANAARTLARNISATRQTARNQPRDRRGRFAAVRG